VAEEGSQELLHPSRTTYPAPASATAAGSQEVAGESRTRRRSAARTAIVGRDDLDVLYAVVSISVVVFNPDIRKVHLVVEVRQVVLTGPMLDFLIVTSSAAVAGRLLSIAFLKERLILALQLVVEDDATYVGPLIPEAFRCAAVGSVEYCVVSHLAWLPEAFVEHLPGFWRILATSRFEQVAPLACEDDNVARPAAQGHRPYQPLVA
jgi:hypothetical protein